MVYQLLEPLHTQSILNDIKNIFGDVYKTVQNCLDNKKQNFKTQARTKMKTIFRQTETRTGE